MIEGKVWGSTRLIWKTPFVEVHALKVLPYAFCSMHMHERKWNGFFVIYGELRIEVEKAAYGLTDSTILRAGDFTTVKPGEYHRFVSGSSEVEALEIYCPEGLSDDIVRRDCGGLLANALAAG